MSIAHLLGTVASSIVISGGGGPSDSYWNNVTARYTFDSDLTDSAIDNFGRTGGATHSGTTIDTTISKFGGASLSANPTGTSTQKASVNLPTPSFFFGTDDFTVELWIRTLSVSGAWRPAIGDWVSTINGSWTLQVRTSGTLELYVEGSASSPLLAGAAVPATTWQHIALTRQGTTLRLFQDGVQTATTTISSSQSIGNNCFAMTSKQAWLAGNNGGVFVGNIDDVRITRGLSRYNTDFTPPATAHPVTGTVGGWATPSSPTSFNAWTNIHPVAGWGTIKRNPSYSGPALRVGDNGSAAEVDVNFDANGYVTGDLPYGVNTRVVKVYDQWGSDDLTCLKSAAIRLIRDGNRYKTWRMMSFEAGSDKLKSTKLSTGASVGAWVIQNMVWAIGCNRWFDDTLRCLWGLPGGSYMSIGVWAENTHWHWRVNSSSGQTWPNTEMNGNYDKCGGDHWERLIGDLSQNNTTAYAYHNNTLQLSTAYTYPISWPSTEPLKLFNGTTLDARFYGAVAELHIFSSSGAMTGTERGQLDTALGESIR